MRQRFFVRGMDCAHETALLRKELGGLDGVEDLSFDLTRQRMTVLGPASRPSIEAAVARTGMRASPWTGHEREDRSLLLLTTGISGLAGLAGVLAKTFDGDPRMFFGLAIVAGIWHVLPKAWIAARRLQPDMHLLMTIAILGAIGIGEWFEAASVAFLYSLSLALEAWSVGRARSAVEALMEKAPAVATLEDGQREVPAGEVAPKTLILVRPGERVPLDGVIVAGDSRLDESMLTGESLPVDKGNGDEVFAGTINGHGALTIETRRTAADSTLAHIAELVEAAGEQRSRSERWVERFARVYTPAVMALAVIVLLAPPLLFGGAWDEWLYRALVLLVIACPCALVISTPVSIVASLTAAARHGVLVKGGEHMETPARLDVVALDKTGTLTHGKPKVVEVVAFDDHTEGEVLQRAAAIEARSEHPIAHAILEAVGDNSFPKATDVSATPGKGVEGTVGGKRYWVGSHRWLDELRDEDRRVHDRLEALAGAGRSVLFVGSERHVCGLIAVADEVRGDAREHLDALRAHGVGVVMLTGDNRETAEHIGRAMGVEDVRAELLPAQKVEAVAQLASEGSVAMVGDGINDAAAMARADLGVAMGVAGTDVALEAADVALMRDDLSSLSWLVGHSRRTLGIIRQNVGASLLIKAAFVVLTFAGPVTLWAAIAADMGVSLAVVANALRLLR